MKKRTVMIFGLVMLLTAPMAMAGAPHGNVPGTVDLGLIVMPRHDFDQLRALVAATGIKAPVSAIRTVHMEAVGPVEMTTGEAATLRQMVAGNYVRTEDAAPSTMDADIQLGMISMPRTEYDALRAMVHGYRLNWGQVIAETSSGEAHSVGR